MTINIQALMALSAADVANELWHWESPLWGGADKPMATYPQIDFVSELTTDELTQLVKQIEHQGMTLAKSGIADHEASDDEILIALGSVNESKKWTIVDRQCDEWNLLAEAAIAKHNIVIGNDDDIDGFIKTEIFRGADGGDAIASAISKFGEAAIVQHAVAQINSTKQWWDFADYLKGASYEAADKAYANCNKEGNPNG